MLSLKSDRNSRVDKSDEYPRVRAYIIRSSALAIALIMVLLVATGPAAAAPTTTDSGTIDELLDKPEWSGEEVDQAVEWVRSHEVSDLSLQEQTQLLDRMRSHTDQVPSDVIEEMSSIRSTTATTHTPQPTTTNAPPTTTERVDKPTNGTPDTVEYQLSDVVIHNVTFVDGGQTVRIEATWDQFATVSVTDSGAVQGLGSHSGTGVPYQSYSYSSGTHNIEMPLKSDAQVVTIQQGDRMYAASGDRSLIEILQGSPTVALIRWSVIAGALGSILALGLSVGYLRRRHENTYKELIAEERVRVEEDPVEGVIGRITRFMSEHQYLLGAAGLTILYLTLSLLGWVAGPGDVWGSLSDPGRVILLGSFLMMLISFTPVYALSVRLFEPNKEYIIDLDARDVLDPSLGSNSGLALDADSVEEVADELDELDDMEVVAVYSGSPDRVTQMRVDGEPAEIRTPGGRGYLVEDFDPKRNAARGTWPGTASDVELLSERSKIDGNREILRDESRMLRRLIGALPAISTASDTSAMQSIDKEIRNLVSVDSDPVDELLDRSAQGTRFEGLYTDDEGDMGDLVDEDDQKDDGNDDQDDEDGQDDDDGRLSGVMSS
ncbi:hypothetical protein HTSR_0939 [Halodesulfurarchaeum formicicum]|uniref:Uncharacterized protein n=1 Tax=Halodesulfurarchaeum formicicum TaxID=1873524 RepID=A0A1D8S451_9EURY|nr:hypothetical protein [Halodesulfurarchaeum formicicum]AOW80124.1 hypothetical protein HTSR_0939 [Halodesulfurarchaeum formicicum]